MQISDASLSTHRDYQDEAAVQKSSTGDHRHLIKLVGKGRSILKGNDMLSYPQDPDIINLQDLQRILAMKIERRDGMTNGFLQDRIIVNISGTRFETFKSTLEIYPNTLLGNAKRRKHYYDAVQNEYFFDRHRQCFEAILYYYQSNGRLRRPDFVPIDTFLEEITFFDLDKEALAQVRKDENLKEIQKIRLPQNRCRRYLWATLEYPEFSFMAKCVHVLSLIVIFVATIALAIESLPGYVNLANDACKEAYHQHNITAIDDRANTNHTSTTRHICLAYFLSPFNLIQTICVGFFTIELILRIVSMPSIWYFIKNIMNWIDVFAVVPFYVTIGIYLIGGQYAGHTSAYAALQLLRVVRFTRVLKFYRIFKNVKAIRVLAVTLQESLPDFFILIAILTLLAFLFGAVVYFVENTNRTSAFDSIPKATYWGIITITSVGYGDIAPITPIGRMIACLCALSGAGTIAMLVSVLVDRYQRVYTRKRYIKPEKIDLDESSDEGKHDPESEPIYRGQNPEVDDTGLEEKQEETPQIYREKDASERNNDENDISNAPLSSPSLLDPVRRNSNRFHIIITYTDGNNSETSNNLLDKIISVASEKQFTTSNMTVNVISGAELSQSSLSLAGLPNLLT